MRFSLLLRLMVLALPLVAAACDDSDLFQEKKTPLPGTRKDLFPNGVPGVNTNQPLPQPSNSNIPLNTEVPKAILEQSDGAPAPAEQPKGAQKKARKTQQGGGNNAPDDPWADAR